MNRGRVVLTGATGFIGSYLAEELVAQGYEVMALRRQRSDSWRVASVAGRLIWVNNDEQGWEQQLRDFQPEYLVHAAWLGVSATQRDDWQNQLSNVTFTMQLLQAVQQNCLKKVVVLGSQAEYGAFEGRINETHTALPTSAYGAVKMATLQLVRAYSEAHNVDWHWLRVFAVFGPREDAHWFVSFVSANLLKQQPPDLTACEQRYDYIFAPDLARIIIKTLSVDSAPSGIYNVGANKAVSLKQIVDILADLTHSTAGANYGAIPYRQGQVMHMEGNSDLFRDVFGPVEQTSLRAALTASVEYVKRRL